MPEKFSDLKFMSFDEGINRITSALQSVGIQDLSKDGGPVITSRDAIASRLKESLKIHGLPAGFEKWQLPVYFLGEGAQFFISVAAPRATADEHAHDNGAAMRFIVSGSITYGGQELTQGDWMFVPKGSRYSFAVGEQGAVMCYCYKCCCATSARV